MRERRIQFLNLYFPWCATVDECQEIAKKVEDIIMAGVSEGGMTPTNKYGLNVDDVTFSEESMSYTFGHNRNQTTPHRSEK